MLRAEAIWISDRLRTWSDAASPILNVGSADEKLRSHIQPWIDRIIFEPLRHRGMIVWHQDLFPGDGVDLVGDFTDPKCRARARALGIRSVICSNVLEHVVNPAEFAMLLLDLVPPGGRLLITVPHAFPYHPDPIDTMFRPTVAELAKLFPEADVLRGELVAAGRLLDLVFENPQRAAKRVLQLPGEFFGRIGGRPAAVVQQKLAVSTRKSELLFPWFFRSFQMACLDLQKR